MEYTAVRVADNEQGREKDENTTITAKPDDPVACAHATSGAQSAIHARAQVLGLRLLPAGRTGARGMYADRRNRPRAVAGQGVFHSLLREAGGDERLSAPRRAEAGEKLIHKSQMPGRAGG